MRDIVFQTFDHSDIPVLTDIMTRAFDADALMHTGKKDGPTGYNTGDFLRKYGFDKKATSFKLVLDNKIIGALIYLLMKKQSTMFLETYLLTLIYRKKDWD